MLRKRGVTAGGESMADATLLTRMEIQQNVHPDQMQAPEQG